VRYALSKCQYDGDKFTGPCVVTGKEQSVVVTRDELKAYQNGAKIQDAMPRLSNDEREFLMSGISGEGWKQTFGVPRDEDSFQELHKFQLRFTYGAVLGIY